MFLVVCRTVDDVANKEDVKDKKEEDQVLLRCSCSRVVVDQDLHVDVNVNV